MLHAGIERDHRKIVRIRDGVDVARQPERKLGERDHLRKTAACRRPLDVEGRTAGRLTHTSYHLAPETPHALHETERRRRLAFAERCRSDGGYVNVLGALLLAKAGQHLRDINLCKMTPIRLPLVLFQPEFRDKIRRRAKIRLRSLRNLPILHLRWIKLNHIAAPS